MIKLDGELYKPCASTRASGVSSLSLVELSPLSTTGTAVVVASGLIAGAVGSSDPTALTETSSASTMLILLIGFVTENDDTRVRQVQSRVATTVVVARISNSI